MSLKPGFSWDPQAAKQTAALLPEEGFTAVHDREQVTHLIAERGRLRPHRFCGGLGEARPRVALPGPGKALSRPQGGTHPKSKTTEPAPIEWRCWPPADSPCAFSSARTARAPWCALPEGGGVARGRGCLHPLRFLDLSHCGLGLKGAPQLVDLLQHPAAAATAAALEGGTGPGGQRDRGVGGASPGGGAAPVPRPAHAGAFVERRQGRGVAAGAGGGGAAPVPAPPCGART